MTCCHPQFSNVVTDAVVRHWLTHVCEQRVVEQSLKVDISQEGAIFYVKNGWLLARETEWI